ncbi:MAG: YceI family protein [Geminicoccaceae bacterium]|nr:YceI family protein [Geminicoccaceae bacterium]MDW8340976.1 YceI family protein [Geminicoccaceae bacterium]
MRRLSATSALVLATLAASAAAAAEWRLVPESSRILFETRQGAQRIEGGFARWTASIRFDPRDLAGSKVELEVELTSVFTGDVNRDKQALSAEFFDVARWPRARYRTLAFRARNDGVYEVEAELQMKGINRRLVHPARIEIEGERARAAGEVRIERRAFRFGEGPFDSDQILAPEILVRFAIEAVRG